MEPYLVVLITVPSLEVGRQIAHHLVSERLAACVNILPGVTSIYTWEGELQEDQELLCLAKTCLSCFERLSAAVRQIHPYDVPEVIALPVQAGSQPYLDWIAASTGL